ncbi:Rieske (2Fe-2S) protein [Dehalogenimonas alkenigignens]|uniref:Ferredoxin subunit of nitrite reductase or ring-hydroxylating dioxygenase n=1 Tax=Dehalogenimonas alkenigignens TaxID=1217799 RepID=A0A0W0GHM2_9CHLR|nr:Rieske 2Fe-2S domain-containing protein [Dehalogenimonas alkenigignens]KTB48047.1 Ferredoxin subunit of nitrite reductase or ring-hydroxylating dioxygenase [Dehalogenimonas alkenigignens]PVV84300.1 (2Fe-2S)-binding protein [Dehalogenimonas alkenigignens]
MSIFKAILGICETKPLAEAAWERRDGKVTIDLKAAPQLAAKGGGVYLRGKGLTKPVLVVRGDDNKLYAYENSCTHGHRKIDPVPGEGKLKCCSVNHSTFSYDGKPLSGPAKHDIKRYEVRENGGRLEIKIV